MGEENKNVKKPAVSNAVVKKRSAGTGTKSTGGTRPGNGTKSTGSTRVVAQVLVVRIQIEQAVV